MVAQQIILEFNSSTHCVDVGASHTVRCSSLVGFVSERHGVPSDALALFQLGGRVPVKRHECVPGGSWVRCELASGGLLGGKGGFGQQLRQEGKSKSGKGTTNFGACRDLNGRRLRHVNNEIRLKMWRDEQERRSKTKGGSEVENQPSSLNDWFLPLPSWADAKRGSQKAGAFASQCKSDLCRDWVFAREGMKKIPPGAPSWWGCPRGRFCTFAHGKKELTDKGLQKLKESKKAERLEKETMFMRTYVEQIEEVEKSICNSISSGLKRSREEMDRKLQEEKCKPTAVEQGSSEDFYVRCLSGDVGCGETGEVEGRSSFATVVAPHVAVDDGQWYFECELTNLSQGIVQVGFAKQDFKPDQETNDGVGDKAHSWGLDIASKKIFDQGVEHKISTSFCSASSCTIGCSLDVKEREITFQVDGKLVLPRVSFQGSPNSFYFPSLSLELSCLVRLNLGERTFRFKPTYNDAKGFMGDGGLTKLVDSEESLDARVRAKPINTDSKQQTMLELEKYDSVDDLAKLDKDVLKKNLEVRGLKCGGTVEERAKRLFSIRGLRPDQYDPSLFPKKKKQKK
uniref:Uncharacterized protein n=1 Tax=Mucochytrium quahogii TaxID=96639 RepID=A0A7S2RN75_9STRA|mmetsp:Transcript_2659/g.5173  ORF Transcript_2659/g.5173 Transcript_2659/m.5173 type:complete len:570 (+) Transcript_2659:199-1908(+)|eukprot:CAMPEP_0203756784 /NCGR_PEP_ID=MMETSP0098-20131031/9984_1 /ASSEMBLY_ACC=CAM_ASM_000208 /TAXON_ID=96639 /ORGANISM=" , Strain NY0313808BC1" /LENGTH=569 /DNA_ID=CAMNT_0050648777 /DNA_START=170 /DNA_END=1879 /DNA_ORIENTATION=+